MADLDDVRGNNRDRRPMLKDVVGVYEFPHNKWATLRLFPGLEVEAMYWVKVKKRDGKMTKFPTPCPSRNGWWTKWWNSRKRLKTMNEIIILVGFAAAGVAAAGAIIAVVLWDQQESEDAD